MADINQIKEALGKDNFAEAMGEIGYRWIETGGYVFQDGRGTLIIFDDVDESFETYMLCRSEQLNSENKPTKKDE